MTRVSSTHLFRRQLLADRGAALTVAVVVLVVSALLAAWPRVIEHMFTTELREQIEQAPPPLRDVVGAYPVLLPWRQVDPAADPAPPSVESVYGDFDRSLTRIRNVASPLVMAATSPARYVVSTQDGDVVTENLPAGVRDIRLFLDADPRYADEIRMVEGAAPAGVVIDTEADLPAEGLPEGFDPRPRIVDIALSAETAERLEWPVGEQRPLASSQAFLLPVEVRLTGVFDAADAEADYWRQHLGMLQPGELHDFDRGITLTARAFIDPVTIEYLSPIAPEAHVWFPVSGAELRASDGPALIDQLRALTADTYPVTFDRADLSHGSTIRLTTGTIDTMNEVLARQASASVLLAMVAAGPFGVAIAVLAVGARLVVDRRGRAMALVSARGASGRQLRTLLALEGALLGLPAAALAIAGAGWLVPGQGGLAGVALPLAVGLAPVVLLPFVTKPGRLRVERTDLGRARRGWLRRAVDVLIVGFAVTAWVLLNRRGLSAGEPGSGVDPLLVATPLLLATAACVVVLRVYAFPVVALGRLLKRRRGVVGFLGAIRAVRDPAAGLAPVLALVVGLSVAVFSTVLWSTTQAGGVSTSVEEAGADLRADGPVFTAEQAAAVEDLPWVTAAATVTTQGPNGVSAAGRTTQAEVFLADTSKLAEVQANLEGVAAIPEGLDVATDGVIPVMMSDRLGEVGLEGLVDVFGGQQFVVTAVAANIAGLPANAHWVLIDEGALPEGPAVRPRSPRTLLIGSDGTGTDQLAVKEVLAPQARLTAPADVLAQLRGGAVGTGLISSFVTAVAVVGVLSGVAMILTMVIGAPARGRLFSQLRTLGLSGRQAQGLAAWEMAPLALVALAFGTGLGVGIPWVVFSAIDLRPLTGAAGQPPVIVDWSLVGAAACVFVGIVAVAVVVAVVTSRRLRLGTVLRVGEEL